LFLVPPLAGSKSHPETVHKDEPVRTLTYELMSQQNAGPLAWPIETGPTLLVRAYDLRFED